MADCNICALGGDCGDHQRTLKEEKTQLERFRDWAKDHEPDHDSTSPLIESLIGEFRKLIYEPSHINQGKTGKKCWCEPKEIPHDSLNITRIEHQEQRDVLANFLRTALQKAEEHGRHQNLTNE